MCAVYYDTFPDVLIYIDKWQYCVNTQYAEVKFIIFYSCGPKDRYAWPMMNILLANFLLSVTEIMTLCTHYSSHFHPLYVYRIFKFPVIAMKNLVEKSLKIYATRYNGFRPISLLTYLLHGAESFLRS